MAAAVCRGRKMAIRKNNAGFTLMEMVVVLAILGTAIASFHGIFINNWTALDTFSVRANLSQEMDDIVDTISYDARNAQRGLMDIATDQKSVVFSTPNLSLWTTASYTMAQDGTLTMVRSTADGDVQTRILSRNVDYANSTFNNNSNFTINLELTNDVFGRPITIDTSTEIFARN